MLIDNQEELRLNKKTKTPVTKDVFTVQMHENEMPVKVDDLENPTDLNG
jgi:hypothetical protein